MSLHFRAADPPPLEELAPPQHRVVAPEPDHPPGEVEELALLAASESQSGQLISLSWQ